MESLLLPTKGGPSLKELLESSAQNGFFWCELEPVGAPGVDSHRIGSNGKVGRGHSAGCCQSGRGRSVRRFGFRGWRARRWCSAESRSVVTGSIAADLVSGGRTPIHPFVNQPDELDWSFPGLAAGGHGVFQFDRPTHVSRLNQCFARGRGGNGVPTALVQGPPQTGWTWWGRLTGGARLRCRRCHGQRARVVSVRSPGV